MTAIYFNSSDVCNFENFSLDECLSDTPEWGRKEGVLIVSHVHVQVRDVLINNKSAILLTKMPLPISSKNVSEQVRKSDLKKI